MQQDCMFHNTGQVEHNSTAWSKETKSKNTSLSKSKVDLVVSNYVWQEVCGSCSRCLKQPPKHKTCSTNDHSEVNTQRIIDSAFPSHCSEKCLTYLNRVTAHRDAPRSSDVFRERCSSSVGGYERAQGCAGGGGSSRKQPRIFSKQVWALQAQENGDNEKSLQFLTTHSSLQDLQRRRSQVKKGCSTAGGGHRSPGQ